MRIIAPTHDRARAAACARAAGRLACLLALGVGLAARGGLAGEVTTYAAPAGAEERGLLSSLYTVRVDGRPIPVYRGPDEARNNCFAFFDLDAGPVTVEVTRERDDWPAAATIRPQAKRVAFTRDGRRLTFTLAAPANLSVEADGRAESDLLMLFANPPVPAAEKTATHVFGPGYHLERRSLDLGHDESVYVDGGAIVEGLRIDGRGRIAGRGILVNDLRPNGDTPDWKPNMLSGSHISGVIQWKTDRYGFWGCQPGGRGWVIDNLKILSEGATDDGIDPQAAEDGVIRNCFLRTKDDGVSPKVVPWFPEQRGRPCRALTVTGCVFFNTSWGCGTRIGVETAGEISDITYRDCDVIHAGGGPEHEGALVIWGAAEGTIHHITYDDVRLEDVTPGAGNRAVSLLLEPYKGVDHSRGFGSISHVTFRKVQFHGPAYSTLRGLTHEGRNHLVSDITFDGCTRDGKPLTNAYDARLLFLDDNVHDVRFPDGLTYNPGAGYIFVSATTAPHTATGFGKVTVNDDPNVKLLAQHGDVGAALAFTLDVTQPGTYGLLARTGAGWQHDHCGKVRLVVNGRAVGDPWDQSNAAGAGNGIHDFGTVDLPAGPVTIRFELAAKGGDGWLDLDWFQAVLAAPRP